MLGFGITDRTLPDADAFSFQHVFVGHPEAKLQVFSERFGNIGKVSWQADFDDLAALDQYQQSFDTDQGYWALVSKSTELFIEDSLNDKVFETL